MITFVPNLGEVYLLWIYHLFFVVRMKQKKKRTIDIQFVTATISTSLVLLLLGAVALVVLSAKSLSDHVRENLELSLLLNDNVSEQEATRIVSFVEAQGYTKNVHYISKEDILAEQTASMRLISGPLYLANRNIPYFAFMVIPF